MAPKSFEQVRAQLRANQNLLSGLANFRTFEDVDTLLQNAGRLATTRPYSTLVNKAPFPTRLESLAAEPFPYRIPLDQTLAWRFGVLASYSDKLNKFLEHREALEDAQLFGSSDLQTVEIASAEAELGQSIWLLDAQLNQGSDTTKRNKVASAISSNKRIPSLVRHLASWLGYRGAAGISVGEVDKLLGERASPDSSFGCLVHYMLGRAPEIDDEMLFQTLFLVDNLPIIDQYNFLIMLLSGYAKDAKPGSSTSRLIVRLLRNLSEVVNDGSLSRLRVAFGDAPNFAFTSQPFGYLLDQYTIGNYLGVLAAFSGPAVHPSVEAIHLCVRAAAAVRQPWDVSSKASVSADSHLVEIASDLHELADFTDEAVDARFRLEKLSLRYSGTRWGSSLAAILGRQQRDERVWGSDRPSFFHGLRASIEQPIFACLLSAPEEKAYLEASIGSGFATKSCQALLVLSGVDQNAAQLPIERVRRLEAYGQARRGEFDRAGATLSAEIGDISISLLVGESLLLLVQVHLANNDLSAAVSLAARLIVQSSYFGLVLPIRLLVSRIIDQHDLPMTTPNSVRGQIGVPIILDIYSRQVASDRDSERADSFQDVLQRAGVTHASALPTVVGTLPVAELAYFLRFVCVPDVLDQSLALRSTKAVEDERIAILVAVGSMLSAHNRTVPAAIKEELSEISTRQVVRDATRRLDQSKVYVNVDGIRRSMDVTMRENWNRYRLSKLLDPGDGDFEALRKIVESALGSNVKVAVINAPLTQSDQLFRMMITEIRDQFASHNEFGLNANLSTNIRHGYVLRELRGPFTARNLITNKDSESGAYQENDHWAERVPEEASAVVQNALTDFSRSIDDAIEHINRKLLRIRSATNPLGLFVYEPTNNDAVLEATVGELDAYEDFVTAIIDYLWVVTENNLKRIRQTLLGDQNAEFSALIAKLERDVSDAGADTLVPSLSNAITLVRQEFRDAMTRVADWFTLSRSQEYENYQLQIAYQAGLQSVKRYYSNLHIDSTFSGDGDVLMKGWSLPILARLFFLLLENAASHGARQRSYLTLTVVAELTEGCLFLRVANDLDAGIDETKTAATATSINVEYGQEKAAGRVGEEGGSGYPKIWKLLSFDLRTPHDLQVSYKNEEFVVEIAIGSRGLLT